MKNSSQFRLERFLKAQDYDYEIAVAELRSGRKKSRWIWYIFPQIFGLGSSSMAIDFAIQNRTEALAYLTHPMLGKRLRETTYLLLDLPTQNIADVTDNPDDLKLKSSMTLFSAVSDPNNPSDQVLTKFFDGRPDQITIKLLERYDEYALE